VSAAAPTAAATPAAGTAPSGQPAGAAPAGDLFGLLLAIVAQALGPPDAQAPATLARTASAEGEEAGSDSPGPAKTAPAPALARALAKALGPPGKQAVASLARTAVAEGEEAGSDSPGPAKAATPAAQDAVPATAPETPATPVVAPVAPAGPVPAAAKLAAKEAKAQPGHAHAHQAKPVQAAAPKAAEPAPAEPKAAPAGKPTAAPEQPQLPQQHHAQQNATAGDEQPRRQPQQQAPPAPVLARAAHKAAPKTAEPTIAVESTTPQPTGPVQRADTPESTQPPVRLHQLADATRATIRLAVREGRTDAHITLRPPELGQVRIRLRYGATGISATLTADSQQALSALSQALPELRRGLEQQGLTIQNLDLELAGDGPRTTSDGKGTQEAAGGAGNEDPALLDDEDGDEPATTRTLIVGSTIDVLA
jgi:flagellar hook-length control protein FliK